MRKIILTMTLTLMLSAPVLAVPVMMELMAVEQIDSEVTMVVEGNTVTVNGAEGLVLEIISLTGRKVAQYEINSPSQRIELNLTKGCYVFKIGKVVRKVAIR
ncbi:T9SS type A sorting domain-containing protein [Prevotella sp. ne3005]|uniref:T9SS type A sorting domain-containing protein n=1 Tax=Prevotella sp. ne3005 TaxID=1761887 RepID=UPI000B810F27|nr:T9SS type A sorting domain-containing protein [Prevotella sp. ne3005]